MTKNEKNNLLDYFNQISPKHKLKSIKIPLKSINDKKLSLKKKSNDLEIKKVDSSYKGDTPFLERFLYIDGYKYNYLIAGNFKSDNIIILLGGFPLDEKESLKWLVSQMNTLSNKLTFMFYIFSFPYLDKEIKLTYSFSPKFEFTYSKSYGIKIGSKKEVDLSNYPVDPRFNLINQAKFLYNVLTNLDIKKAHFIGHGIGCGVFDYLVSFFPEMVRTYSRSGYYWDIFDDSWLNMLPEIKVGFPIKYLNFNNQVSELFNTSQLCSPLFIKEQKGKENNSYNRLKFIETDLKLRSSNKDLNKKISEIFKQIDINKDIEFRKKNLLLTDFPILQFEGEEEFNFSLDQHGFFPYFGIYNLFKNDIYDVYDSTLKFKNLDSHLISNKIINNQHYKKVEIKKKARINQFVLIPESSFLTVIENPNSCAHAIIDFIT